MTENKLAQQIELHSTAPNVKTSHSEAMARVSVFGYLDVGCISVVLFDLVGDADFNVAAFAFGGARSPWMVAGSAGPHTSWIHVLPLAHESMTYRKAGRVHRGYIRHQPHFLQSRLVRRDMRCLRDRDLDQVR